MQDEDAADLVQDVLVVLVRKMPELRYEPGRTFRGWMRTVLINKWRDRPRRQAPAPLDDIREPAAPCEANALAEREYRVYVVGRALELLAAQVEPATWQAYWETMVRGRPAFEVAAELGLSLNALYLARSRVLARLRKELEGLLD